MFQQLMHTASFEYSQLAIRIRVDTLLESLIRSEDGVLVSYEGVTAGHVNYSRKLDTPNKLQDIEIIK